jgi:plasmid replication initiation protein
MEKQIIQQDNRITTARYELSIMEKRIMYILVSEIRKKFVINRVGDVTLFEDMIIKITSAKLIKDLEERNTKRIKKAFKSLRLRSFEWNNGKDEDSPEHEWFEVGFINYGEWKRGGAIEFQVSKLILPYFVALTEKFTEYNLIVAISLKSKWSQRFYEICNQWRNAGGTILNIKDLRDSFGLTDKYVKYGSFKKFVIDVGYKELKDLYHKGQSDIYFEYSEVKNGRSVTDLRLKIITENTEKEVAKTVDVLHLVREDLYNIFETRKKEKNKEKIQKLLSHLILNTDQLYVVYGKIEYTKKNIPRHEWQKYLRAIFNAEYNFKNL